MRKPRARFKLKLIDKFNYYLLLLTAFHSELIANEKTKGRIYSELSHYDYVMIIITIIIVIVSIIAAEKPRVRIYSDHL